jgi:hypothetical protein
MRYVVAVAVLLAMTSTALPSFAAGGTGPDAARKAAAPAPKKPPPPRGPYEFPWQ